MFFDMSSHNFILYGLIFISFFVNIYFLYIIKKNANDYKDQIKIKKRALFLGHVKCSQSLREMFYLHKNSSLTNESYFNFQIDYILNSEASDHNCTCIFIKAQNNSPEEIKKIGFYLKLLEKIKSTNIKLTSCFEDDMFVLLMLSSESKAISNVVEMINKEINMYSIKHKIYSICFTKDSFFVTVCNKAKEMLLNDKRYGDLGINTDFLIHDIYAKTNWDQFIDKFLKSKELDFYHQPVFYYENNATLLFHNELIPNIKSKNKDIYKAGIFLPVFIQMGKVVELETIMLQKILDLLKEMPESPQRIAVNISEDTLKSIQVLDWFTDFLAKNKIYHHRLCLEFDSSIVQENVKIITIWHNKLYKYGVQMGINHFGISLSGFSYLLDLPIEYIKIDGSFSRLIEKNKEAQLVLQSLVELAHGLDLLIFMTNVETKEGLKVIEKLMVDGTQGFFVGQPS